MARNSFAFLVLNELKYNSSAQHIYPNIFLPTPSNKLLLLAYQNVYYLLIKDEKDLLIFGQILNFKPLYDTPATAAVFYCNSSTTLASAMYYTMGESFVQKSWVFFFILIGSNMVLYRKWK